MLEHQCYNIFKVPKKKEVFRWKLIVSSLNFNS